MKRFLFFLLALSLLRVNGQSTMTVYSNSGVNHGNWDYGSPNQPWWYCGANRDRPDIDATGWSCSPAQNGGKRHNVEFDHNNNLSQTVNGNSWYELNKLTFKSGVTSSRTFGRDGTAGISLWEGIDHQGLGTMTFNVPLGIDGNCTIGNSYAGGQSSGGRIHLASDVYINDKTLTLISSADGYASWSALQLDAAGSFLDGGSVGGKIIVKTNQLTGSPIGLNIYGTVNYQGLFRIDRGIVNVLVGSNFSNNNLDVKLRGGEMRIYDDVVIKDLYIIDGKIGIWPGGSLTVLGNVYYYSTSQIIDIQQNTSGVPGQLKIEGNIYSDTTGNSLFNGTLFRTLNSLNVSGHHGVSSPFSQGFVSSTIATAGVSTSKLYGYDESNGQYMASGSNLSNVGRGFFAPVQATNGFFTVGSNFYQRGTPNLDVNVTLKHSTNQASGGSGDNWNFIGNPFLCALDFTALSLGSYINAACYIWDPTSNKYDYFVSGVAAPSGQYKGSTISGQHILPGQAFWVQLNGTSPGSADVTLNLNMVSHGVISDTTQKYRFKNLPDNIILLVEEVGNPINSDATWIKNVSGSTLGFEGSEDAWKREGYGGQPMLSSVCNDELIAINAVDLSAINEIPIAFSSPSSNQKFLMSLEQVVNYQPYEVFLEDRYTGTFTNLVESNYKFEQEEIIQDGPRFILHINQNTVEIEEGSTSTVKVYQQGDRLKIQGSTHEHSFYTIITLDGRKLAEGPLQGGMANVEAPIAGVYILQLTGTNPVAQRVIVQ